MSEPGCVIGIAHNQPVSGAYAFSEASADVLAQVEAVERVLDELGHRWVRLPFTRDVNGFIKAIQRGSVNMVFNLCETVDEDPTFSGHPAALLELLGIPFSGSPSMALMVTTDKVMTKRLLDGTKIATPKYVMYDARGPFYANGLHYPVIVKPRFQDASIGIDQEAIFENEEELRHALSDLFDRFGSLVVEEFIEGREFNVSLFGYPSAEVLPIAEIDFSEFPAGLHRIVGYSAKWDRASFEYHHTPRKFPQELPASLLATLEKTALQCFGLFMLRDYGRVDMRIDDRQRVYVLEVNANPCLSPDAGFAATAEKAGMTYSHLVSSLLHFMIQRSERHGHQIRWKRFTQPSTRRFQNTWKDVEPF
jgi:D-alanine-D-alanine ligase